MLEHKYETNRVQNQGITVMGNRKAALLVQPSWSLGAGSPWSGVARPQPAAAHSGDVPRTLGPLSEAANPILSAPASQLQDLLSHQWEGQDFGYDFGGLQTFQAQRPLPQRPSNLWQLLPRLRAAGIWEPVCRLY